MDCGKPESDDSLKTTLRTLWSSVVQPIMDSFALMVRTHSSIHLAASNCVTQHKQAWQPGDADRGLILRNPKSDDPLKAMLITLWDSVVQPIMDSLDLMVRVHSSIRLAASNL